VRLQIDTENDAIILNGKTLSLQFLDWFLNQPAGTIVEWMGEGPTGNQTFRDVTNLVKFKEIELPRS
jgi:hypothetical protein